MTKKLAQYLSAGLMVLFGLSVFIFDFTSVTIFDVTTGFTLQDLRDIADAFGGEPSIWITLVTIVAIVAIIVGAALGYFAYKEDKNVELIHFVAMGLGAVGLLSYFLALDGGEAAIALFVQGVSFAGVAVLKFLGK